jgi:hypothetical protein
MAVKAARSLSAVEICKIITECKLAGVSELVYAGISLKFHSPGQASVAEPSQAVSQSEMASNPVDSQQEETSTALMNPQAMEDIEDAQLLIDDPLGYERSQIFKDLERNRVANG